MGMSNMTGALATEFRWSAGNNLTGAAYQPISNAGDIRKSQKLSTALANNLSGGADEVFSFQQPILAGGSATLDLTAMTNLLGQATVSIARIKAIQIRLLSGADDSSISPAPTDTSTVTITNRGVTVPCALDFGNGGSGLTANLTVGGGGALSGVAVNTAGTGYPPSTFFTVTPNQAGGSNGVLSAGTNAAGGVNTVTVIGTGTGYANATAVPTTVDGAYNVLTGGAHVYFDPAALGFCIVDSTHKNVKIINLDATHAVTVEVDIFAGTT